MVNMNYLQSKVTIKSTIFLKEIVIYPWELLKHINRGFETKLKHMTRWYYEILEHDIIICHSETKPNMTS